MDFLQMHDGAFGMFGRHLGMPLVAMRNRFFQFADAFVKMRVFDVLLSHFRMAQGFLRMADHGIGMSHATMFYRFFRVRNRFMNVLIPIGKRRCCHQNEHCRHH